MAATLPISGNSNFTTGVCYVSVVLSLLCFVVVVMLCFVVLFLCSMVGYVVMFMLCYVF